MTNFLKRLLDVVVSSIILLASLIFILPIMIVLKFTGEGEVFYFQERIGLNNKKFRIWKFATMQKNSSKIGTNTITVRNDSRVTSVGKLLRITKVNELPQIINVLKGDMSLVGPRPLMTESFNRYPKSIQSFLYTTKPGMTGIGSVLFRDEEKIVTIAAEAGFQPLDYYKHYIYDYKGELELWYQKNFSFFTDLKILFLTFWQILFSESDLAFRIFKNLPPRPDELTTEGIAKINLSV